MQVTTLSAQFDHGSELVDWYRDETSVPFGHMLIDLSPRTDDRLRYCTNTGSIPSKFHIPDRQKQSKILDNEHTKSLYSQGVPTIFPQMRKSFASVLLKRFYPVSLRMHKKLLKGNLQSIKRHHPAKLRSESRKQCTVFISSSSILVFLTCSILSAKTEPLVCVDLVLWMELNKCFLYFFLKSLFFAMLGILSTPVLLVEMNCPLQIIKELSFRDNNFATKAVLEKCIQTVHVLVIETE